MTNPAVGSADARPPRKQSLWLRSAIGPLTSIAIPVVPALTALVFLLSDDPNPVALTVLIAATAASAVVSFLLGHRLRRFIVRAERRRAELSLLLDAIPYGLLEVNEDMGIESMSIKAAQLLGVERRNMGAVKLLDCFAEESRMPVGNYLRSRVTVVEAPSPGDTLIRSKISPAIVEEIEAIVEREGVRRIVMIRGANLPTHEGSIAIVMRDVTEEKQLTERVRQNERLAEMGTLAAGVAHELNNPLAAISAFAQSLDNASMPPDEAEALDAIIEESRRAKGIVQNILGFARRRKPDRRPVDLAEVVERILTLRKHEHRKNDVHVSVDFAPECPLAVADENELQQVLLNLIVNAAHALLEKSSGSREIVIRGRGDARKGITITIEDNGVGIPSDVLPKLFDPFFTTKPEGLGTGLGLSISYGIVAEHGGRIWAENREEGGARFIVELLSVAGRGVPTAERSTEALVVDVGRQRVLVADDDSGNRRALSRVLKKLGHDVEAAHDGTSAFELIMANSFDVVISDLHMPGLSGKELFEAVLRDRPQMARRFVFMSGDTVSHDARSFLESTGQPSLQKPYELDELQLLVARIIAGSSRARPSMTYGAMLPPG